MQWFNTAAIAIPYIQAMLTFKERSITIAALY
jgi:hypothetical protein